MWVKRALAAGLLLYMQALVARAVGHPPPRSGEADPQADGRGRAPGAGTEDAAFGMLLGRVQMNVARAFRIAAALMIIALAVPASAQFGHPLKGSWSGDWTPAGGQPVHVLLELTWDGKAIGGTINPGPNAVPLRTATLDAATWRVHLEAEGKDASAGVVRDVIDGTLANIGAYKRVITGTWSHGAVKGPFKITRN